MQYISLTNSPNYVNNNVFELFTLAHNLLLQYFLVANHWFHKLSHQLHDQVYLATPSPLEDLGIGSVVPNTKEHPRYYVCKVLISPLRIWQFESLKGRENWNILKWHIRNKNKLNIDFLFHLVLCFKNFLIKK